jgi:hypothetical protein
VDPDIAKKTVIKNINILAPAVIKATAVGLLILGASFLVGTSVYASKIKALTMPDFPSSPAEEGFAYYAVHFLKNPWILFIIGLELCCVIVVCSYVAKRFSKRFTNLSDHLNFALHMVTFFTCMTFLNPLSPIAYFSAYKDSWLYQNFIGELLFTHLSS